ncbi:unnamed protein product [Cylicocyclus nassatus]|uniref:Uncharacterized protein n=1 Tax=Cylicocyclus nassatus TaxID=53992 RepID=A0AA36GPA7_CYLNA|nr:unnamed protein product [Cylicocyclus nassatus]
MLWIHLSQLYNRPSSCSDNSLYSDFVLQTMYQEGKLVTVCNNNCGNAILEHGKSGSTASSKRTRTQSAVKKPSLPEDDEEEEWDPWIHPWGPEEHKEMLKKKRASKTSTKTSSASKTSSSTISSSAKPKGR